VTAIRTERAFPIRGIREDLPEGERVLWQGAPDWRDLALTAFHVRKVALYFAALLALRCALLLGDGLTLGAALRGTLPMALLAATGVLLLVGIALWSARSTIYAITTARVVLRVGMALPIVINLPFSGIQQARLAQRKSGHGDLPLVLQGDVRLAYAHLWPYARPWKLAHPEPMMRAVPRAAEVAQLLGQALATSGGTALVATPLPQADTPSAHRGVGSPVLT
jgi:hypothetical protein